MADVKTIPAAALNLIDESFDARSNAYQLAIVAGENGFTSAILDSGANRIVAIQTSGVLNLDLGGLDSFKAITCAVAHNKFTLVPSALYDEENKASLLGFNYEVKGDEEIHVNTLRSIDAKNIFTVSKNIAEEVRGRFPNVKFLHASTSFVEGLLLQHKNSSGKRVFANFHPGYFEVVILEGKELLFCNAFRYKTPEDIAYYILFVYEQLNLNPETIDLILSGEIGKTAKEHALLYTYIRNVKFALRPDGFKYSYKFEDIPAHRFYSLFNQFLVS